MTRPAYGRSTISHWDDRDLFEAYLLIRDVDILSAADHSIFEEMNRRAAGGGVRRPSEMRERMWPGNALSH
jgi:hypothetical protein